MKLLLLFVAAVFASTGSVISDRWLLPQRFPSYVHPSSENILLLLQEFEELSLSSPPRFRQSTEKLDADVMLLVQCGGFVSEETRIRVKETALVAQAVLE